MAQFRIALLVIGIVVMAATTAAAQTRSEPGMFTVARTLGTSEARDSDLGKGFHVAGTIGRHLTPRIAIEVEVGGGNFEVVQRASSHNLNVVFLSVNLDYVWRWDRWSSFVTGGIGAYRYSEKSAGGSHGAMTGRDLAAGASVGGGLEYLLAENMGVTVHARYHAVSDVMTVRPLRASFSAVSLGFRRHF